MVLDASLFRPSLLSNPMISPKFKSLANIGRGSYPLSPRRRTVEAYSKSTSNNDSYQSKFCTYNGRRGLVFTMTLPFLLPLADLVERFDVYAMGVDGGDSTTIMRNEIRKVLSKSKAPGVLRLVFHDAGTFDKEDNSGGMNGSIVYELDRPENAALTKPLQLLKKAKAEVDKIRPVSWADMITLGGAEAVSLCGGPSIPVRLGRVDAIVPDPEGKLPEESLDASGLKECFMKKGYSTQDLVVLSGAHTLGSKGFGNPFVFDNSYFKILQEKPWQSGGNLPIPAGASQPTLKSLAGMSSMIGLPSDHALVEDDECLRWIKLYADDERKFFEDFEGAYIKLVNSGAMWQKSQLYRRQPTVHIGKIVIPILRLIVDLTANCRRRHHCHPT